MTQYREILRLHSQGISQRSIAASCSCSRNTVSSVVSRAQDRGLVWPLPEDMTDSKIQKLLFSDSAVSPHKLPDYEYIHREMAKSGVTLSLLWNEYCESCRLGGEMPFMYTQFCKYYRDFVSISKATMHIDRKPGEQMEVDWAGQTAGIVDNITGDIIPAYVFVAALSCSGSEKVTERYNKVMTWADLFIHSTIEAKKMIVAQFISQVRVGRDYHMEIDLNANYEMFGEMLQEDQEEKKARG